MKAKESRTKEQFLRFFAHIRFNTWMRRQGILYKDIGYEKLAIKLETTIPLAHFSRMNLDGLKNAIKLMGEDLLIPKEETFAIFEELKNYE